jgi:FMN-dependent NADH-azoreductase
LPLQEIILTKLLYIQASPRGSESKSIQVADAYLEALRAQNPMIEVDTIKLWEEDLLSFDETQAAAKMKVMTGQVPTGTQKPAWDEITAVANRFIAADRYLLAVPMWNGGIPYRLKHYIDIIHQPGLTWGLNPKTGFFGLLKNKHATVVLTSGAYAPGFPAGFGPDHHSTYVRDWLTQAGVEVIDEIRFQPTLLTSDQAGGLEQARQAAIRLAVSHAEQLGREGGPTFQRTLPTAV